MVVVTLPYPPSANNLWRNGKGSTFRSTEYKRWLNAARAAIPMADRGLVVGPFSAVIEADRPDRRVRDLDNIAKPTLDALKSDKAIPALKGVIRDDSDAVSITLRWSDRAPGAGAQVRVSLEAA